MSPSASALQQGVWAEVVLRPSHLQETMPPFWRVWRCAGWLRTALRKGKASLRSLMPECLPWSDCL
ncbi:hypothetical protein ACHAPM_009359 [Fusarium culmorum]